MFELRMYVHEFYWYRVKWYCHFDDDVYVNVKELSKLLAKYNSSKPYYIGRNPRGPNGVKVKHAVNNNM